MFGFGYYFFTVSSLLSLHHLFQLVVFESVKRSLLQMLLQFHFCAELCAKYFMSHAKFVWLYVELACSHANFLRRFSLRSKCRQPAKSISYMPRRRQTQFQQHVCRLSSSHLVSVIHDLINLSHCTWSMSHGRYFMPVWLGASVFVSISEVTLHRARLVLGEQTAKPCNKPPRSAQPGRAPRVGPGAVSKWVNV